MEKTSSVQELGSISNFFISASEERRGSFSNVPELKVYGHPKEDCEIEESVTARKRIAYANTRSAQENMKKNLFAFLQEGYTISRIELKRTSERVEPGSKTITNEEIALFLK
jgi:hypothetical protein